MAYSISESANVVLKLLDAAKVGIDGDERDRLSERGDAVIGGFRCKIANVLTLSTARVMVNTSWFNPKRPEYGKPHMQHGSDNPGIDYQLIPTSQALFAIHYLDLRHYAMHLEKDREHWFGQSYWGVQVQERTNTFVWTGGNTLDFPLLQLTKSSVLQRREQEILESMRRQ